MAVRLQPLHPGELLKELLSEAGLTVNALALALRVPANRIGGIVNGQRGITDDTSLRLARYFGTPAQMWMNLQAKYDLAIAEDAAAARIRKEQVLRRVTGFLTIFSSAHQSFTGIKVWNSDFSLLI